MKKRMLLGLFSLSLTASLQLGLSSVAQAQNKQHSCEPAKTGNPCVSPGNVPRINIGAGNPIHLVTGNKFQQENDLYMRPSGLEIVRYYHSVHTAPSVNGAGWRHAYSSRLYQTEQRWQILTDDGSRVMFHPPANGIAQAVEQAYGQLTQNQAGHWQWVTPEGVVRTYSTPGYLIHQLIPGYLPVYIDRLHDDGPLAEIITQVRGGDETLLYHYEDLDKRPRLSRIESPMGWFSYQYEQAKGYTHTRLSKVIRGDLWQRSYHYEPEHQSPDNPFQLTGISLSTPEHKKLRLNTWAYDAQGRANFSSVGLQGEDELHIDYLSSPTSVNAKGLTRVRDKAGNITDIYSTQKAGQYLVEQVTGHGCHLCPAVGTQVSYDSAGRMSQINGHPISRDEQGRITKIVAPHPSWGPITIEYDKQHRVESWHTPATGKERIIYNDKGQIEQRILANRTSYRYDYSTEGKIEFKYAKTIGTDEVKTYNNPLDEKLFFSVSDNRNALHFRYNTLVKKYDFSTYTKTIRHVNYVLEHFIHQTKPGFFTIDLPEFGELEYQHKQDGSLAAIVFTPWRQKAIKLVNFKSGTTEFGNGLHLTQSSLFPNLQLRYLKSKNKTLWLQLKQLARTGELLSEYSISNAQHQEKTAYLYDRQSRLVSAYSNINQDNTIHYHYAWNPDGSTQAYQGADGISQRPQIKRDESGFPLQIGAHYLNYNQHRRISTVSTAAGPLVEYRYDATGRRVIKRFKDKQYLYYYMGNKLIGEWLTDMQRDNENTDYHRSIVYSGSIHRRYIYAGDLAVAFIDYKEGSTESNVGFWGRLSPAKPYEYTLYYIHSNPIGQPIMVTNSKQNIRWLARYTPTGQAEVLQGDLEFNLRAPGQYYDAETGWHDNYYRTYDPQAGHYLEPDPLGPLSINDPYGYAAQQPRRYIDPEGLLLFAFDGTTNNKAANTNVLKMFKLYDDDKFYKEGPGGIPEESTWDKVGGLVFNTTAEVIFEEHKENLLRTLAKAGSAHYDNTIPIDIVGFSRGAAIGMTFANFLKDNTKAGFFNAPWFDESQTTLSIPRIVSACLDLRFIGLFDTVAQYGVLGTGNFFVDYSASSDWDMIAHAVALNEHRYLLPLVTYQDDSFVLEQPFLGNHSDVGGVHVAGDTEDKYNRHPDKLFGDLSHIPLAWMYTQAQNLGVPLKPLSSADTVAGSELDKVKNPIIHGNISPIYVPWIDERGLERPNKSYTFAKQHDNKALGKKERETQAREAEKEDVRFAEYTLNPLNVEVFGYLNAKKYLSWLEHELGWVAPLEVIPFEPTKKETSLEPYPQQGL